MKPASPVKAFGMHLRMEDDAFVASLTGVVQKGRQDSSADTLSPVCRQYCHPADVAIRQEPAGSDHKALFIAGQCVDGVLIHFIPLQLDRNTLLVNEDRGADCSSFGLCKLPVGKGDSNHGNQNSLRV